MNAPRWPIQVTRARRAAALLPVAAALCVDWAAPGLTGPYHWFPFYPAVFAGSWIGGRRWGLLVTFLSTAIVWWFFIPPERALVKDPQEILPAAVFAVMGVFFAVFHHRLRTANARMRKLVDERRIFSALIENSSDFIGIADATGKPLYVNPAGRRMVGMAADYPVGETKIAEYYPPEQRGFVSDVILKAMMERGRWKGETYFRNWQTQEPIPVSDEHFMIREPETGRVLGMGTVTRDISDIQRAREEVVTANRRLERALQARDDVLGVVAHDLRNPLNAIVIQAALLQRRGSPERRNLAPVLAIRRAAARMSRMIHDLLDVARLEAGQALAMEPAAHAPRGIVQAALDAHAASAAAASIELVADVRDCADVWGDRDRLLQVLDNLVSNAIKFTPARGRITLGAAQQDADVVFCVTDTGAGLPPGAAEHLFDRFWQADARDRRGAGLGLSVAKALVEAHGGRIWAESRVGEGTRVCFTIPVAVVPARRVRPLRTERPLARAASRRS